MNKYFLKRNGLTDVAAIRKLAQKIAENWDRKNILELCEDLNVQVSWNEAWMHPVILNRETCAEIALAIDTKNRWRKYQRAGNTYFIAHCLGHLFVHCHYAHEDIACRFDDIADGKWAYTTYEYEADVFALELLFPDKQFYSDFTGKSLDDVATSTGYPVWVIDQRIKMGSMLQYHY